jgi:hypothetical protein
MLQAGWSTVRFPMRWLDFSNWCNIYFQPHCGPGVDSASNRKEYQKSSWEIKGGRRVRLTTWDPRLLTAFTFFFYHSFIYRGWVAPNAASEVRAKYLREIHNESVPWSDIEWECTDKMEQQITLCCVGANSRLWLWNGAVKCVLLQSIYVISTMKALDGVISNESALTESDSREHLCCVGA